MRRALWSRDRGVWAGWPRRTRLLASGTVDAPERVEVLLGVARERQALDGGGDIAEPVDTDVPQGFVSRAKREGCRCDQRRWHRSGRRCRGKRGRRRRGCMLRALRLHSLSPSERVHDVEGVKAVSLGRRLRRDREVLVRGWTTSEVPAELVAVPVGARNACGLEAR